MTMIQWIVLGLVMHAMIGIPEYEGTAILLRRNFGIFLENRKIKILVSAFAFLPVRVVSLMLGFAITIPETIDER